MPATTAPCLVATKEILHLKLAVLQNWVKRVLQKQVALQTKGQANNAIQAELESKVFIGIAWACEGYKATKALRQPFQSA